MGFTLLEGVIRRIKSYITDLVMNVDECQEFHRRVRQICMAIRMCAFCETQRFQFKLVIN